MGSKTLSDITDVLVGYAFKSNQFNEIGEGVHLVRGKNVTKGALRFGFDERWWTDFSDSRIAKYYLRSGDVVIGMDGSRVGENFAQINENDLPALLVQRVACLRPKTGYSSDYIYALVSTGAFTRYVEKVKTGTTIPHISAEQIKDFPINDLDSASTYLIGCFASSLKKKIELNNRLNDYLLELATTIFEDALVQSHTEVLLSDVVELEDSQRIPLNSRDREQRKGSFPYYGATSIMDYVDDFLFDGIRILLGEDGTVIREDGRPVLQYVWGKYWVNNHAHVLKASSVYPLEMLYVALSRTAINHIVTGAVQMKISQKNLKGLVLEMPDPTSVSCLADIFAAYRANMDESRKLEELRDALLPRLMSGVIDVSKISCSEFS